MQIKQEKVTVKNLVDNKAMINLNPMWQRGPAWKLPRKVLLIDSILRDMDIPKIYLREMLNGLPYNCEAVDGQQRLRSIFEFRADSFALIHPEPLSSIDGYPVSGLHFSELDASLQSRFDNFEISVGMIKSANIDEITNLFSRLQMGVSLNPAELRNAMMGPMRHSIDVVANSHRFFLNSRIQSERYKRQDYVTHAYAIAAYQGERDIKAPDLKNMISEYHAEQMTEILEISAKVGEALEVLADVNNLLGGTITQKWIFVDLCWLIMDRYAVSAVVCPKKLADSFRSFESLRRKYTNNPAILLDSSRPNPALDRQLYNYITAFKSQGGISENLQVRNKALRAFCQDIDVEAG